MRIGNREVRFSNPDKMFFPRPGLTKGELDGYYLDVAPCLLHHRPPTPGHQRTNLLGFYS